MKPFLDEAMTALNTGWQDEEQAVRALVQEIFSGVEAALVVFGSEVGRKWKGGQYERQLNRALFEVQAYHFSFPEVRNAAFKHKKAVRDETKSLFDDSDFVTSIEATTKSIDNYRTRFGKYQRTLQSVLGIAVRSLVFQAPAK